MNDTPVRFATYPGDARGEVGKRKGPNTIGEIMRVVTAAPKLHRDGSVTTRLGFAFGSGPEPQVEIRSTAFGLLVRVDDHDWVKP